MSIRPISGYPTVVGDHKMSVFPHTGPASYATMTAAPVAGGDTVQASQSGLKHFDVVQAGLSDSGTYRVEAVAPAGNPSTNPQAAASATSYKLRWIVVSTGAQVANATDLSAETVRLTAFGRY